MAVNEETRQALAQIINDALKDRPTTAEIQDIISRSLSQYASKQELQDTVRALEGQIEQRTENFFKLTRSVDEHLRQNEYGMRQIEKLIGEFKPLPEAVNNMQEILMRQSETLVNQTRDIREIKGDLYGNENRPDIPSLLQQIKTTGETSVQERKELRLELVTRLDTLESHVNRWVRLEDFITKRAWPIISSRKFQISAAIFSVFITGRISAPSFMDSVGELIIAFARYTLTGQ